MEKLKGEYNYIIIDTPPINVVTDALIVAPHTDGLVLIVRDGFTDAVFCGVTGGRLDHTFANIQMLKFLAEQGVDAVIVDKTTQIRVVKDTNFTLPAMENSYFSVFSLDEKCTGVSETGGKYELCDVELTNSFPIGVSNEFCGRPVTISVKKGSLLVMTTGKD